MGLYSHTLLKFESSSGCHGVRKSTSGSDAHSVNNRMCFMHAKTGGIRVETKLRHPDSAEPSFMMQKSATQMSGERCAKKHCTRLPSQRSACCCSPSLVGDSATLQQTKNTAQQPAPTQMNNKTACLRTDKKPRKKEKEKERLTRHCPCRFPAPSSVRLHASFNAAVGLVMCASHSACRTEVLLSICRALLRSLQAFPLVLESLGAQRLCLLTGARLFKVDRFVQFHMLVVHPLPLLIHQMPLKMA